MRLAIPRRPPPTMSERLAALVFVVVICGLGKAGSNVLSIHCPVGCSDCRADGIVACGDHVSGLEVLQPATATILAMLTT